MIEKQHLIDAAALIEQVKGITEEWTTDEVIDLLTFAPVIEARPLYPCNFARCPQIYSECSDCALYRDGAIPADIARKLGIQPITEA